MRTTLFVRLYGAQMVGGFVLLSTWTCRISVPRVGSVYSVNRSAFGSNYVSTSWFIVLIQTTPFLSTAVAYGELYGVGSGYSFT